MSRLSKLFVAAAVVVVAGGVALGLTAASAWRTLNTPVGTEGGGALIEVSSGMSLAAVSTELERNGVLDDAEPRLFRWYVRLNGLATRLHAGEYRIDPDMTPLDVVDAIVAGDVHLHEITVVEGWRFTELLDALRGHPAVAGSARDGAAIMAALGRPDVHPEGQFLPDTYRFPKGTPELELLRIAHDALQRRLESAWAQRDDDISITMPYEALILASIIEKETALAAERGRIAGVFHRRLERGMRLQTDPTVIYGLGDAFDGNLRRADLERDTPYNTYTRRGLPPTPIALPSAASIEAAVAPESGTALYFVATGEPDGSHTFSETLEQHNEAVRRYVERERDGDGSE